MPVRPSKNLKLAVGLFWLAAVARADDSVPPVSLAIARITGTIAVDGNLDDEGWRGATPIDTWYETNPGDNVPPKVKSVAFLGYDDKYFYAGFRFEDPNPKGIRAPWATATTCLPQPTTRG